MLPFELTTSQLLEVKDALTSRIQEGLTRDGAEIKALPSFLSPASTANGQAIVLDTGGTNMRAAFVELRQGVLHVIRGPVDGKVPGVSTRVSRNEFFAAQAKLIESLEPAIGLPIGYCFSYPSAAEPSRDARLIRWTKGIDVPGVEGELVGKGLLDALDPKLGCRKVCVLNDTVATLLAGSIAFGSSDVIGLIAGTGTNIAAFFDGRALVKLIAPFDGEMAVNLESGNFHPPHLANFDDQLAARLPDPTLQRFEKAVSGYYLPLLYAELTGRKVDGARAVVELAPTDEVAAALLGRSADLIAAALAGVAAATRRPALRIVAEGSLFWGDPNFAPRVARRLRELSSTECSTHRLENTNLLGAAAAAVS